MIWLLIIPLALLEIFLAGNLMWRYAHAEDERRAEDAEK
jgi:hypothetical protein